MGTNKEHDVRVFGYPMVIVSCHSCRNADQDPLELHRFERGHAPSMLELNTVTLNHYRETTPPPDVSLAPLPMP